MAIHLSYRLVIRSATSRPDRGDHVRFAGAGIRAARRITGMVMTATPAENLHAAIAVRL